MILLRVVLGGVAWLSMSLGSVALLDVRVLDRVLLRMMLLATLAHFVEGRCDSMQDTTERVSAWNWKLLRKTLTC